MFGLNAVMLPEHMRNAGMAEVRSVSVSTGSPAYCPSRPGQKPHHGASVQHNEPPSSLSIGHTSVHSGTSAAYLPLHGHLQGGKERLLKYMPVVEARMADGRKYIAGNEFTAAGDLLAAPGGIALVARGNIRVVKHLALMLQECASNRLSSPPAGHAPKAS